MKSEKDSSLLEGFDKIKSKSRLPEGANPTEWDQLLLRRLNEEIKIHRFLHCPHYRKCLDYASKAKWRGWSCHWCPLKVEEKEVFVKQKQEKTYEKLIKGLAQLDKLKNKK